MRAGEPSRTALFAALHRAVHLHAEGGVVLADRFAAPLLGQDPALLAEAAADANRGMRGFVCARARLAEDAVADRFAQGWRQVVVLGAGLDSFAYRQPHGPDLQLFEVDHPATGAWKRERLTQAGIPCPPNLRFVAVNFEQGGLVESLTKAGFDPASPAIFLWLGVVPYLTDAAIFATLASLAAFPAPIRVVFDYGDPIETLPEPARQYLTERSAQAAQVGEAWLSFFEPDLLHARLRQAGWQVVADWGPREIAAQFSAFFGPPEERSPRGGHVLQIEHLPGDQTP